MLTECKVMLRSYQNIIFEHLTNFRQMVFLVGARQVGKTTLALSCKDRYPSFFYFNFDRLEDRHLILSGARHVWEKVGGDHIMTEVPLIVFDEIHKYSKWKVFIKGFFDSYGNQAKVVVTGSAKMDVYTKGGDSLMGRYLPYTICPVSIGELAKGSIISDEIRTPYDIGEENFQNLWTHGGFPELFLKANKALSTRINKLRSKQLFYEDIREIGNVQEIKQLEVLAELMKANVGSMINRSQWAQKVNVSVSTISRWLGVLEAFYYSFEIRPYSKNVTRSLIKEPKIYLWDWSLIKDQGAKAENFVACHLLKAVHYWNDQGMGDYGLYYLRDKEKREVDFLVTKDGSPWFLAEVKSSDNRAITKNLHYFQEEVKAPHAFQVAVDGDYVEANCFAYREPIIVPARTLLSQLW